MKFPLMFVSAGQIMKKSPGGPPPVHKPAPPGGTNVLKAPQGPPPRPRAEWEKLSSPVVVFICCDSQQDKKMKNRCY